MRQIVLDTETTGLYPAQGHRIIEIGAVELINRRHTRNTFHRYINPEREIEFAAQEVHGITSEFLQDKPLFKEIADEFIAFVDGAELIIHNAPFDIGFIDHELKLMSANISSISDQCSVVDTLLLARKKHPGLKNNLDALCRRYNVDNSRRELHGALLDAHLLAEVYLAMTGGQGSLFAEETASSHFSPTGQNISITINKEQPLKIIQASLEELTEHEKYLQHIKDASKN